MDGRRRRSRTRRKTIAGKYNGDKMVPQATHKPFIGKQIDAIMVQLF
jgi:hypothetical protein